MRNKEDIQRINLLIDSLCKKNSTDKNIPRYIYHFTDIDNIVSIIQNNFICSRKFAIANRLMKNDNASAEVIEKTTEANKNYVRFYFRPKTPTQYHNEGIKSKYRRDYKFIDAHCPIPIFLLFNAKKMLSIDTTKFVERNLALNPPIKNEISDLLKFDFEKIYHTGSTDDKDVIGKRHAEVLIEEKCDLKNLEFIACRSKAEKETLINMLNKKGVNISPYKFIVDKFNLLYNKSNAYIDYVELEKNFIKIGFTNFNQLIEEDEVVLKLNDLYNKKLQEVKLSPDNCVPGKIVRFNKDTVSYEFSIKINGKIVYMGNFNNRSNLPF